jgi:PAS domain S-box-containing protein
LAVLQSQIERLLDGDEAGVYGVDRNGHATLVTPAVAAMTGHTVDDLVGRSMHEVLHHSHANGDCYPREDCPIYAAFRDGKVHRAQEVFWRKDGSSFPIEYTSTPLIHGGALVGAVVVFRDLGRRREVHDRIRDMMEQIRPARPAPRQAGAVEPVGKSEAWLRVMDMVRRVAPTDTTVLLLGESGTGKEPVARAIHDRSPRRGRPLVKLNCAAIPASLIESELFGHEKGAFTGATARRIGRFEQAGDGTLFLDEVGELSLDAQAKLLRVLQEREFERVGGTHTIVSRARVVAATNRNLEAMVEAGQFRADLLYRLAVFPVRLPPLRERREDIPLLVRHFLGKLEPRVGRPLRGFSPQAERRLHAHGWPGNVRELENVVERAALLAEGPVLEAPALGLAFATDPDDRGRSTARPVPALRVVDERAEILAALERSGWKVTGPRGAAAALAVHPNTLRYRMRRLGLLRPPGAQGLCTSGQS